MNEDQRVVLITGASRGIGRAIALQLAGSETVLLLNHYDPEPAMAEQTLRDVEAKGARGKICFFSVADFQEVQSQIDGLQKEWGRIDVLINNAGITKDSLLMRMKEEDWDRVMGINLKGVFNCTQAVIRSMIRNKSGKIVNIASVSGVMGNAGQANYAASKAGIIGFTKSVAKEVAARGIQVNAIAPGFIETEMTAVLPEQVRQEFLRLIPMGRSGQPEEVAELAAFLVSKASDYITGQVIHISGGMYM
ncbi:MAG: 3-oxoacyl-[acyl-carrier-protein] reductase [Deltaproteobacteria bacterium RBG_13_43_22]|nr:MAG: 3-oxoacyl-[acyl-carrier-protein] reductase [Deltaproteobacteria bacterium RBG_13_43_22]